MIVGAGMATIGNQTIQDIKFKHTSIGVRGRQHFYPLKLVPSLASDIFFAMQSVNVDFTPNAFHLELILL